jgi:hypothetical protein
MPNDPDEFKNLNGANNANDSDDIISSSFAVQFKPGDKTESVADKLKETRENLEKGFDPFKKDRDYTDTFKSNFKDEFDDFEFDSSISAFQPLAGTPAPAAETKPAETAEPAKAAEPVKKPDTAAQRKKEVNKKRSKRYVKGAQKKEEYKEPDDTFRL